MNPNLNLNLTYSLRQLAARLPDEDAKLLWRAANQLESLPAVQSVVDGGDKTKPSLAEARRLGEKQCLLAVVFRCSGNLAAAGDRLGITRIAVQKALVRHGLIVPYPRKKKQNI